MIDVAVDVGEVGKTTLLPLVSPVPKSLRWDRKKIFMESSEY